MRIYLDTCALNRLTDSPSQLRVRLEAAAVIRIFEVIRQGRWIWVASFANEAEIRRNPNHQLRLEGLELIASATDWVVPDSSTNQRGVELARVGYGVFDALHIACAEKGKADVLITTDDRLINRASRRLGEPAIRLINPLDWVREQDR